MKDVIFRQRSAIKHISKENATIQRKYEFYKLQNKSLSRASKQMKREVNKVCKKNEALEHELESLRTELQELAKVETL
jgi:peptidoglycan hydrolase CwlO-like protein